MGPDSRFTTTYSVLSTKRLKIPVDATQIQPNTPAALLSSYTRDCRCIPDCWSLKCPHIYFWSVQKAKAGGVHRLASSASAMKWSAQQQPVISELRALRHGSPASLSGESFVGQDGGGGGEQKVGKRGSSGRGGGLGGADRRVRRDIF